MTIPAGQSGWVQHPWTSRISCKTLELSTRVSQVLPPAGQDPSGTVAKSLRGKATSMRKKIMTAVLQADDIIATILWDFHEIKPLHVLKYLWRTHPSSAQVHGSYPSGLAQNIVCLTFRISTVMARQTGQDESKVCSHAISLPSLLLMKGNASILIRPLGPIDVILEK